MLALSSREMPTKGFEVWHWPNQETAGLGGGGGRGRDKLSITKRENNQGSQSKRHESFYSFIEKKNFFLNFLGCAAWHVGS